MDGRTGTTSTKQARRRPLDFQQSVVVAVYSGKNKRKKIRFEWSTATTTVCCTLFYYLRVQCSSRRQDGIYIIACIATCTWSLISCHVTTLGSSNLCLVCLVFSVARWRFSPPDLQNSGGFESRLAGKKYFWRTPNFWRISGGFDQFLHGFVLVWRIWRILAVLESLLAKNNLFLTFSCIQQLDDKK
jgi:hypothetical protein